MSTGVQLLASRPMRSRMTPQAIAKDIITLVADQIDLCDKASTYHILSIPALAKRYRQTS